jgi:hypothetical protein
MFMVLVVLFIVFTPKIFFSLPIKGSKYTIAFVHAILFALTWVLIHTFVWKIVPRCRRSIYEGATDNSNVSPKIDSNKDVAAGATGKTATVDKAATPGTNGKVAATGTNGKTAPVDTAGKATAAGTSIKVAPSGTSIKAAASGTSIKAAASGTSIKAAAGTSSKVSSIAASSKAANLTATTQKDDSNLKYTHLKNEIVFDANQIKIWKDQLVSDQNEYNRLLNRSPPNPFRF